MPLRIRAFHRAAGLAAVILIAALALAAANARASSPVLQGGTTTALEAPAATGPLLSYQGRLVHPTTGNPLSGTFAMTFKLYAQASGGSALWTETKNVAVTNGQFSTLLGDITALNLTVFDGRDLWLGVQVGSDVEATPRAQIAYAPYALYTSNAAKLGGQLPSAFAVAGHQHNAADIAAGTLNYAQFSAYGDLQNEAKIGTGATQVAAGDHLHDNRYYTQADTDSLFVNDNAGEVGNQDVPDGALSPAKIAGTVSIDGHQHDATAITSGTLSGARYSAFQDLNEEGRIGPNSNQVAPGDHGHFGATWSGNLPEGYGLSVRNEGTGDGIRAYSNDTRANWAAVYAVNGSSGSGVYASSNSGYAGLFSGPVLVTGNLTVPRIAYSAPRTQYFVVGGEGFVPGSNVPYRNTYGNGGAYIVSGSGALVAPVHLPEGAQVTEFKVFFYDVSTGNISVSLDGQGMSGGYFAMAQVSSAGISGYGSNVTTNIQGSPIANTLHSYCIYAWSDTWDGGNLLIKGALITYTISEAP